MNCTAYVSYYSVKQSYSFTYMVKNYLFYCASRYVSCVSNTRLLPGMTKKSAFSHVSHNMFYGISSKTSQTIIMH